MYHRGCLGTILFGGNGLRLNCAELCVGGGLPGCFERNGGSCYFGRWLYYLFKGWEGVLCPILHVLSVAGFR